MAENRRVLLKILSSIRILAGQALALHGHDHDSDANLVQLVRFHGEEDKQKSKGDPASKMR